MEAASAAQQLLQTDGFGSLVARVDSLLSPAVDEYTEQLPEPPGAVGGPAGGDAKAFKDAIWGMVDLTRAEVAVVDSPVMQRLRRVRQLGISNLTYPTAGYSRFEHSIGAVHQAERMLRTITARSDVEATPTIASTRPIVRLAALVHDVGHMPLSHVTERFYTVEECTDTGVLDEIEDWQADLVEVLQVPAPRLAECFSVAMVLSPCFKRMARRAGYDEAAIATAALAIVGRPPALKTAFVAQLITNVVDADKLDYMFRDAFVTRVPLAVDLERLLYKLKLVRVTDVADLRGGLRQLAVEGEQAWVLGTDLAGQRLAYDLALSRSMLFERIYLHHKTRAAERVALRALDLMDIHPVALLGMDDSLFLQHLPESEGAARPLVDVLRNRRLPRRAFAFSYAILLEVAPVGVNGRPQLDQTQLDGWGEFEVVLSDARARTGLEEAITKRRTELAASLGVAGELPAVWLDTLPRQLQGGDDSDLLIERPDGTTDPGANFPAEAAAFAHSPAATSHVFVAGTDQDVMLTHLATELVLAESYGLVFGRASADHAKVDFIALEELKRQLEAAQPNLYRTTGRLRPRSAVLGRGEVLGRVSALASRFQQYHGDADVKVDRPHVRRFLHQFPESLILPMLDVLDATTFVSRKDLGEAFLEQFAEDLGGATVMVPLTSHAHKSAAHMAYYFADYPGGHPPVMSIDDALKTDSPIVVFDDCLLSGTQAADVVKVWFGHEGELYEDLARPLSDAQQATLQERGARFRFAYGYTPGLAQFKDAIEALTLGDDVRAGIEQSEGPVLDEVLAGSSLSDVRDYLAQVGTDLLMSTKHTKSPKRWPEARCRDFALGYGGVERLVVLPYNTPTGTITALWKSGLFGATPWMPLVPRRGEFGSAE